MILGIKTGPQKSSISDLQSTKANFTEVWYNVNQPDDYNSLFEYVRNNRISCGLHFWAALDDGTNANISCPDHKLIRDSMNLMKKCIDVASKNKFIYVNIHPGSLAKIKIDFSENSMQIISRPVSLDKGMETFSENIVRLDKYAKSRNVELTVETVPLRIYNNWYNPANRIKPLNVYEMPVEAIYRAKNLNISIANDFSHTAASIISDDINTVKNFLLKTTRALLSNTKLLHLGFITRPYNGTDIHDSLDNPVFKTKSAIPNESLMKDLLKMFASKPNSYALVEPSAKHVKNFFLAREILQKAGVLSK